MTINMTMNDDANLYWSEWPVRITNTDRVMGNRAGLIFGRGHNSDKAHV